MAVKSLPPTPLVLGALASPIRLDLLVILESSPPIPVAELARRIGRRPDALYHHLRALQRAGVVEPGPAPPTGGRPGTVWRLRLRPVRVASHALSRRHTHHAERVAGAITRAGLRDYRAALRRAVDGDGPFPRYQRSCVWLTLSEKRELEDSVLRTVLRIRARRPRAGRSPYVLTFLLSGLGNPRRGSKSGAGRRRAARVA